ncbi:MAG: hypothetical protein E4H18_05080 [Hyphomicrobiales bacterium]|nr:MAG: hypothetical protein E4H18_05080 [Hyphomicrobiales bacterium]
MSTSRLWRPTREQVLRRQDLMDRMMATSGVGACAALRVDGGMAYIEARAKCRLCLHEAACQHWLAAGEGLHEPPDFCPNARFFCALRREDN